MFVIAYQRLANLAAQNNYYIVKMTKNDILVVSMPSTYLR